ncbi:TRNA_processing endoribonuclease Trz1 [Hexamita inflata]|uniref:ribonuclease Z n=1 Tax=Hexamita inflata TaxID=28002 RepID=A0AA86R8B0_9EUKA|nr:TRNA processing endoribonuclease Trz1 [Hexamita inflata]
MCQVYQIVPATTYAPESFIIKVNKTSVIVNFSGQFQRILDASSVSPGDVSLYILTDLSPEAIEEFVRHLESYSGTKQQNNAKIIAPKHLKLFEDLSFCSRKQVFAGQVLICEESLQVDEPEFSLTVQNVNDKLQFQLQPKLEQVNFDKEKIKNLSKKQMGEISQKGCVQIDDQMVYAKDISSVTKCGKVIYGEHFSVESNFDLVISSKLQGDNVFNMTGQGYPVKEFIQFYNTQSQQEFSYKGHMNKKFIVFPQKQFGFDSKYESTISQRDFNLLNKNFKQSTKNSDYDNFIEFYGSQGSSTQKYANVSAELLQLDSFQFLIDCGVATLSQLQHSQRKTKLFENLVILITHEHTDHYFGLGAVLSHYFKLYNVYPKIICPEDVNHYLFLLGLPVKSMIQMEKVQSTHSLNINDFQVRLMKSVHSPSSVHYSISNSSKTHEIVFTGDGRPFNYNFSNQNACKILVHEAKFVDEQEKAETRQHSAYKEAVGVYKRTCADMMIFNHWSVRHFNEIIIDDNEDGKVVQAFDFMVVLI